VSFDVARDGALQIGDRLEGASADRHRVMAEKKPSIALIQEAEVGVKWKTHRG